ncbi:hypothetical protein ACFIJ5_18265 (plasmid) [Haloimpatiens sp. FM7330]|uniref:hypothetical protein n=1 Tax=Haloimpatiens sp. FM7330 TaxID=3298610 RepID=UPI00363F8757
MSKNNKLLDIILGLIQGLLLVFVFKVCNDKWSPFNFDFGGTKANVCIYGFSSVGLMLLILCIRGKYCK